MDRRFDDLVQQLRERRIDRRTFAVRAAALGASTLAIASGWARANAQEGSPEGSPAAGGELTPENLGVPGVEHITTTDAGTINLYSMWPLTAAYEQIGGDSRAAVELALEVYGNAAGGFAINYEALDDGLAQNNGTWDAARSAENATAVVNDANAVVLIGTYNSGSAAVAIPILNQAEPAPMAMVSPANTAVNLTKEDPTNEPGEPDIYYPTGTRNYMRVVPTDDIQGAAAANWAYNTQELRRAYVLHDNQIYGQGVAGAFRDTFESLGGEVLAFEAFDPEASDYQALMTSVANQGPDVLYLGAIVSLNASLVLQAMRDQMPADEVTFLGPDGLINEDFVSGAGDAAEGAYLTFGGLPARELSGVGAAWYQEIRSRLGDRDPDAYAAYSFEAAVVALQGIDQAQALDRTAVLEAMFATEGFRGLLGEWSFSETGDKTPTTISLNVVQDGEITFQEEIAAPE